MPLVTIPQGTIGYVFARDGAPLEPMQTLASNVGADDFTDTVAFLASGGQRGPQRKILREGTYALNLAQFVVITGEKVYFLPTSREEDDRIRNMAKVIAERAGFAPVVIKGSDDLVGVVTVHDGPSLPQGEIIAPVVRRGPQGRGHLPQQLPGSGALPRRWRAAGAAAPGSRRGHLLHQPPVRDGRDHPQDHHRGRHGRRGRVATPASRARTCRARATPTASWSPRTRAASGTRRSCPASTRSTPTPAR